MIGSRFFCVSMLISIFFLIALHNALTSSKTNQSAPHHAGEVVVHVLPGLDVGLEEGLGLLEFCARHVDSVGFMWR